MMAAEPDHLSAQRVAAVVDWLMAGARTVKEPQEVLAEFCERLAACGLPLHRVGVFVRTLHPNVMGRRFLWRRNQGVEVTEAPHSFRDTDDYRRNPVPVVMNTGASIRRRIAADRVNDYPILDELQAEGVTDYVAQPLSFTNGETQAVSWTTQRPGGFTDADLAALEAVRQPLARLTEIYSLRRVAGTLLNTYVGAGPGQRILEGHIRRGDLTALPAAILLSDLRGFTRIAGERPGTEVIGLLNAYFDCLVPAIEERGGEVLKFMGDGLLAIFPVGADAAATCRSALQAALDGRAELAARSEALQAAGEPPLRQGLGLHIGEILYGNIGGASRLDFTAIGPGVNLTARLEALTRVLDRDIVMSAAFAARCPEEALSLGQFDLHGIAEPQEVFAPAEG